MPYSQGSDSGRVNYEKGIDVPSHCQIEEFDFFRVPARTGPRRVTSAPSRAP